MANEGHLKIIKQGVEVWNNWRKNNPRIKPDLKESNLCEANLMMANLREANLYRTNLRKANLKVAKLNGADLRESDLRESKLIMAHLEGADLSGAKLIRANLNGAKFIKAKLTKALLNKAQIIQADFQYADLFEVNFNRAFLLGTNLSDSNLEGANFINANLVQTNLERAILKNCRVYGISAWNLKLEQTDQLNLIITTWGEPTITVDSLEVAQFIYLLLHNEKIRKIIDTITSKVVLILGRFASGRKGVLDAIRKELRNHNYSPVLFDFEKPGSRDFTETISTLAHLSRFIIVDITDPRSVPQELYAIVPHLRSVPVQPILEGSEKEYGMFEDFKKYPWVLEVYRYNNLDVLIASMIEKIIIPAEAKMKELLEKKKD